MTPDPDPRKSAYDRYIALLATGTEKERLDALKEYERLSATEVVRMIQELKP